MPRRPARWFAFTLFAAIVCISTPARAQDGPAEADVPPAAGHSLHGEAFDEGPRQAAYLIEGTGKVNFPVTAKDPRVQPFINQGVGALHGFWYLEAERSFRQAAAIEPGCAIAYWGMAMANVNNGTRAKAFIAEAAKRKPGISDRETMYVDALEAYYKADAAKKKERGEKYLQALEKISLKYPDDLEAKALLALQIWNNRLSEIPIQSHLAVDALLQQVLAVEPLHPCHHYVIHLWDYEKSERALASAARCGQAAPAIAHMWHMPGHIYSRLKRYDDAVFQQEASARVDHAHMIRDRLLPDQIHNFAHNNEWLIRNLNHIGRVHDAVDLAKNMTELPRHPKLNTLDKQGSAHFGRLRLLETLDRWELWHELIELAQTPYLEETDKPAEQVKRLRYLGRAYFASGNAAQGNAQLAALEARLAPLKKERDEAAQKAEATAREEIERRDEGKRKERDAAASGANDGAAAAVAETPAESEQRSKDVDAVAKQADEDRKKIEKARKDAERPFESKIGPLQKAIDEMQGHVTASEGKWDAALGLYKKAGMDALFTARAQSKAGKHDDAEKAVRNFIKSHKNEVHPLAQLVEVLWAAGKRAEAETAFKELREQAARADLDVPLLSRLAPIALELGHPADWRPQPVTKDDVGERPELASLGPFRWQPSPAQPWTLTDGDAATVALQDYCGRPVVVMFYLGYGCLHCAQQLEKFGARSKEFEEAGISVVAISTDDVPALRHSIENYGKGELPFRLASDARLDVFKSYRCYDDFEQQPLHGTFLIDAAGRIRWQDIGPDPFLDAEFVLKEAKRLLAQPEPSRRGDDPPQVQTTACSRPSPEPDQN